MFGVLALGCRSQPSDVVSARLRHVSASIDWDVLITTAEAHRVEPLVFTHLLDARVAIPAVARARFQARAVQQAHLSSVRTRVVHEVMCAFDAERVETLVLKGAALARLVYPTPLRRPMLDVDLLVRGADATHVIRTIGIFANSIRRCR